MPFVFVNQVGADDELFDGRSIFVDRYGELLSRSMSRLLIHSLREKTGPLCPAGQDRKCLQCAGSGHTGLHEKMWIFQRYHLPFRLNRSIFTACLQKRIYAVKTFLAFPCLRLAPPRRVWSMRGDFPKTSASSSR